MEKVFHYYSLTPEWQQQLAEQTGANVLNENIMVFPKNIGLGHSYFTQITPGISVYFIDLLLEKQLKICRVSSDHEIYIFHYDLSEHINLIKINNVDYEIGSYDKLDLAIIDNQIASSFKPALKERTFALRILVDKKLLRDFISKYPHIKYIRDTNTKTGESFYHYGHIDSNSTLLLKSLKTQSIYDLSFDSYLKGISLKLLGNFFGKLYDLGNNNYVLTNSENEAINKTRDYLLYNLYGPFPSLIFLAAMAGMSESKYKMAFKKSLSITPNAFFIQEKMNLARKLLRSGEYNNMTEVMYELNYSKLSYFSTKYFELFKCKPISDFIKKKR